TLVVQGEVDFSNASQLEREIACQVSPTVELDLKLLEFLDSSGAGAIVRAAARLFSRGQVLRLASVPPEIKESLDLIGVFTVLETMERKARERKEESGGDQ
ncbi:MAG: STAS domain-containing protein, partial [Clostridia bacterium]|nr:STAS domain-containing protein [Clostridia bacterium]